MNLKDEIIGGESYSLEFKLVPNEDRTKYLKTVVGFANGRGGRILFGVANDGSVRGIRKKSHLSLEKAIAKFGKDERQTLYKQYLRILAVHKPAVFVMENVAGILSAKVNGERIFPKIVADLSRPVSAARDD